MLVQLQIVNQTKSKARVSVSQWGTSGNTTRFVLEDNTEHNNNYDLNLERFSRSNPRGTIITIARALSQGSDDFEHPQAYFVPGPSGDNPYRAAPTVNINTITTELSNTKEGFRPLNPVGIITTKESVQYNLGVTNLTKDDIYVAINHWGKSGDTGDYHIKNTHTEFWSREDPRGFIMTIKLSGLTLFYYVHNFSVIVVRYDKKLIVTDRGTKIESIFSSSDI